MAVWVSQVSDVQKAIERSSAGMGDTGLDELVISWTNEIVQEILGEMKWVFSERSTTATATADLRYVSVPANALIGIRAIRDTSNDEGLTPSSKEEVYGKSKDPDNETSGKPTLYYIEWTTGTAARIYFDIPWDEAVTLAIDYWHSGDELTAASDLIPIPGNHFHVVRSGVMYLAKEFQLDPKWAEYEDRYRAKLTKMRGRPGTGKGYIQLRPMG